ncbi:MAG: ATP-binding protein [Staphylothermus sp.]|nr:ATP-binding protein [Staphylothermus sp.]
MSLDNGKCIELGDIINSILPRKACIPINMLTHHTLVLGSTGSGKTHTVSVIINRIIERFDEVKTVIFDWHGEYSYLLKRKRRLVPYDLPVGITNLIEKDLYSFIDILADVLELTNSQIYILEKVLRQLLRRGGVSLSDIYTILENFVDESGWMRESRLSLLRKMSPLVRTSYSKLFSNSDIEDLIHRLNYESLPLVIDVSVIKDPFIRKIYISFVLNMIFDIFVNDKNKKPKYKLLIVLEEAQNILSKNNPVRIVSRMLSEIRKFGVGLIIISQSPSSLIENVMVNTNTKIIHSLKAGADIELVNKSIYLPPEYLRVIPYLEPGEAILYTRGFKKPLIVRIDKE